MDVGFSRDIFVLDAQRTTHLGTLGVIGSSIARDAVLHHGIDRATGQPLPYIRFGVAIGIQLQHHYGITTFRQMISIPVGPVTVGHAICVQTHGDVFAPGDITIVIGPSFGHPDVHSLRNRRLVLHGQNVIVQIDIIAIVRLTIGVDPEEITMCFQLVVFLSLIDRGLGLNKHIPGLVLDLVFRGRLCNAIRAGRKHSIRPSNLHPTRIHRLIIFVERTIRTGFPAFRVFLVCCPLVKLELRAFQRRGALPLEMLEDRDAIGYRFAGAGPGDILTALRRLLDAEILSGIVEIDLAVLRGFAGDPRRVGDDIVHAVSQRIGHAVSLAVPADTIRGGGIDQRSVFFLLDLDGGIVHRQVGKIIDQNQFFIVAKFPTMRVDIQFEIYLPIAVFQIGHAIFAGDRLFQHIDVEIRRAGSRAKLHIGDGIQQRIGTARTVLKFLGQLFKRDGILDCQVVIDIIVWIVAAFNRPGDVIPTDTDQHLASARTADNLISTLSSNIMNRISASTQILVNNRT